MGPVSLDRLACSELSRHLPELQGVSARASACNMNCLMLGSEPRQTLDFTSGFLAAQQGAQPPRHPAMMRRKLRIQGTDAQLPRMSPCCSQLVS